jgi:hypothetical protein
MVWLLGRLYCPSPSEDFKAGPAQQNQLSLVPFSAYGKPYPITRL